MRENLEQLEQDGARFRWLCANPVAAEHVVWRAHDDSETDADFGPLFRELIDQARNA